jgi:hypothetical protein
MKATWTHNISLHSISDTELYLWENRMFSWVFGNVNPCPRTAAGAWRIAFVFVLPIRYLAHLEYMYKPATPMLFIASIICQVYQFCRVIMVLNYVWTDRFEQWRVQYFIDPKFKKGIMIKRKRISKNCPRLDTAPRARIFTTHFEKTQSWMHVTKRSAHGAAHAASRIVKTTRERTRWNKRQQRAGLLGEVQAEGEMTQAKVHDVSQDSKKYICMQKSDQQRTAGRKLLLCPIDGP